jgi:hypothetical protein
MKKAAACGLARGGLLPVAQRAATYIVISKPKRKSAAAGVCHCMELLLDRVARRRVVAVETLLSSRGEWSPPRAATHRPRTMIRAS